jgi:hypothetical protein
MPSFSCPHCNNTVNTPNADAGNLIDCPYCKQQVRVPHRGDLSDLDRSVLVVGALALVGCLACFAAISVLGRNGSATFQVVGQSIGAPPPQKAPLR